MPRTPSDTAVLDQAQRRAAVTSYLASNAGEHSVAEIAAATGMRPNVAGKTLSVMADNGLVPAARREGGINYYRDGGDVAPNGVKRTYTKRQAKPAAVAAKDVELVVGGTMIIIGRNADTGRLRITLEDVT